MASAKNRNRITTDLHGLEERRIMDRDKFRVWDRARKEYFNNGEIHLDMYGNIFLNGHKTPVAEGFDIEYYTGLKDKNGVEGYSGSNIKARHMTTDEEIDDVIVWHESSFSWGVQMDGWIMSLETLVNCYHFTIHDAEEVKVRTCRECGCTDDECSQCIEATGQPCHWVEPDLCSRCFDEMQNADRDKAT